LLNKISQHSEYHKGNSVAYPKILKREIGLLPVGVPVDATKDGAAKEIKKKQIEKVHSDLFFAVKTQ
jgi:hypothetical protein